MSLIESDTLGIIRHCFLKDASGQLMKSASSLSLLAHQGIEGDVNANPISPRQVLIVRQEDLMELNIPPGALRENIVIEQLSPDHFVPGAQLMTDGGVGLRLTFYCEPCKQVKPLVRSLNQLEQRRGILGVVLTDGVLKVGQSVKSYPDRFVALSEVPYERFLLLLARIPEGKVITYHQIIQAIGVSRSYYRVLPSYLKKAPDTYPKHRVVDTKGCLLSHLPHQADALLSEGLQLITQPSSSPTSDLVKVNLGLYGWQTPSLVLASPLVAASTAPSINE